MSITRIPMIVLLAVAPAAVAQDDHTAHRAAAAGPQASSALFNAEDLMFLHHMSVHHEQAVEMSALVPERTERAEFEAFARFVSRAQQAEIDLMQSLLELAAERGLAMPSHEMQGDPPMAGMLSNAEMAALEAASGAEFERLWLEGMIFHHEGGLAMARAQQLQQLEHNRRPYGFHVLVEDILIEQRAEITKMREWLGAWGLVSGGESRDTTPPRVEVTSPTPGAVAPAGSTVTLIGLAVDHRDVAAVRVALQDLSTQRWWRADGRWGRQRVLHAAETTRSGPGSVAWQFEWVPPAAGRYGISVEAEDPAGNRVAAMTARQFSVQ